MPQYLTLPVENLHVVPDNVSNQEACFAEPLAAACRVIEQGVLQGATMLIKLSSERQSCDDQLHLVVSLSLVNSYGAIKTSLWGVGHANRSGNHLASGVGASDQHQQHLPMPNRCLRCFQARRGLQWLATASWASWWHKPWQ